MVLRPEPGQALPAGPVTGKVGTLSTSITLKPVARISTSTSRVAPSVVATPDPVTLSMGSVTSSTLSRL